MGRARAPKRKEPGEYHHGDLRRALLDAALAIIVESGPESFSVAKPRAAWAWITRRISTLCRQGHGF